MKIPTYDAKAPIRGFIPVDPTQGGAQVAGALAAVSGQIAARFGTMANAAAVREGQEAGAEAALDLKMPGVDFAFREEQPGGVVDRLETSNPAARPLVSGSSLSMSTNLIKRREGFRAGTYWDVNAHRLGYGSDTITRANGQVIRVRKGMRVSRADADRDLNRRIGEFQSVARGQVGKKAFNRLPAQAQAGLTSVAYNYGDLPDGVVRAVKTGNLGKIANAVARLQNHNKGINRGRRLHEARLIRSAKGGAPMAPVAAAPQNVALPPVQTTEVKLLPGETGLPKGKTGTLRGDAFNNAAENIHLARFSAGIKNQMAAVAFQHKDNPAALQQALDGIYQSNTLNLPASKRARFETDFQAARTNLLTDAVQRQQTKAFNLQLSQAELLMRQQMDAAALTHADSPQGLRTALETIKAAHTTDVSPEMKVRLENSFDRAAFGHERAAAKRFHDNEKLSEAAEFENGIEERRVNAARIASQGGTGPDADAALAGELEAIDRDIDASNLNPVQKARMKRKVKREAYSSRVLGAFKLLNTADERVAFAAQFQKEWQSGEGFGGYLDEATYAKVEGELARKLASDAVAGRKQSTALDKAIKGQIDFLKKGFPVTDAAREELEKEIAKTGDEALVQSFEVMEKLADWQKAHIAARPEMLKAQIDQMRDRIAKDGATKTALVALDVMEGLHKQMSSAMKGDLLGWAHRAGVAKVEPLDFSDGDKLAGSLADRATDAKAIGDHYNTPPIYFQPEEVRHLKKVIDENPLAMPHLVSKLVTAFGSDSPNMLKEISKEAPILAHIGGLVQSTGSDRLALEVAEVLEMRSVEGYKSPLPKSKQMAQAASQALAGSMQLLPVDQNAVLQTAQAVFERRAMARGIDFEDFDTAGDPARALFIEALNETVGYNERDGIGHGGMVEVNGVLTIAPPDLPTRQFQRAMEALSLDDMETQDPIVSANGVPITRDQMRQAHPVMVTPGRYRLAFGNPISDNPKFVMGEGGDFFVLDLAALVKSQEERNAARPSNDFSRQMPSTYQRYAPRGNQ